MSKRTILCAIFALAVVYWFKGGLSLLAMGIGAIVLGVALSYCLHIITHFKSFPSRRRWTC